MIQMSTLTSLCVFFLLAGLIAECTLILLNLSYLRANGHRIPDGFVGDIDHNLLQKMTDYRSYCQRFALVVSVASSLMLLFTLLSGWLPLLAQWVHSLEFGPVASGVVFFFALGLALTLFSLPFGYYRTFVVEQKYGFNRTTIKLWVLDKIKAAIVGAVLGGALLATILWVVEIMGSYWWIAAWITLLLFQVIVLILYPTVIATRFNTFSRLEDRELDEQVRKIMSQAGLSVQGVYTMDAGKRSSHSNAYFTGLGNSKRIVLFDTLISSHAREEIVAILAHEVGHWKKRHQIKGLVLTAVVSFIGFFLASFLIDWPELYQAFGFDMALPYVGLFLLGILMDTIHFWISPIFKIISRRFEREADFFAIKLLGDSSGLIMALKRLAKDNLANLHSHPLFSWVYDSHPNIPDRVQYLKTLS